MEIIERIVRITAASHEADAGSIDLAKFSRGMARYRDSERFVQSLSSAKPQNREKSGGALLFGDAQICTDMKVRARLSRPLAWPEIANKAALER